MPENDDLTAADDERVERRYRFRTAPRGHYPLRFVPAADGARGPSDPLDTRHGVELLVNRVAFEHTVAEMVPGERVMIPERALEPVDAARSAYWRTLVLHVAEEVDVTRVSVLVRESTFRLLVAGILHAFGLVDGDAEPATLRRAKSYIREHAGRADLRVEDIAAAARLSVRGLQAVFQRWDATTPMTYLRRQRMLGVHDDLLRAHSDGGTIAAVTARWGIGHGARFAAEYRAVYGELPSETLRRR